MRHSVAGNLKWGEDLEDCVGCLSVEGEVDYTVTPGDPGCWRTSPLGGWPATGPEVEFYNVKLTKLTLCLDLPGKSLQINLPPESLTNEQREYFLGLFQEEDDQQIEAALKDAGPADAFYDDY
jgi:hypothetical protein